MANASILSRAFELIVGVHDLSDPPDAHDDELLSWMNFATVRPLLDRIAENARQTGVALRITSDDGFRSDHSCLLPWLVENRIRGSFFIVSRFLDRPGRLTISQLREIAAAGMSIGVHGARHINWTSVPDAEFREDVREGKERLEDILGAPVDSVAPPFGAFDGRILAHLRADGFHEIHTCRPGLALRREALKPRNMLKQTQIDAVLATSRRAGSFGDVARCRFRRARTLLRAGMHAA